MKRSSNLSINYLVSTSNPFKIERVRDSLAKNRKLKELKKTYALKLAEIEDLNKPELWNGLISKNIEREKKSPITKDRIKTVISAIKKGRGKLLDVGFGYGFIEEVLRDSHFILHGIDISPLAVKRIKKKVKGNFRISSILKIPYKDDFFDIVLALEVLEHITPSNTFNALNELKRVLKAKGLMIISVPINEQLEKKCKQGLNPSGHVRGYTQELIKSELEIAGFKLVQEKLLYAFERFYILKKFLQRTILKNRWSPNNIIIIARKP